MVASMEMSTDVGIAEANLYEWRKLGQGLHARYQVDDFRAATRFLTAVGDAADVLGYYPRVRLDAGQVDLKLISDDAVYRDDQGGEHLVEWVTQQDIDLARRITEVAADQALRACPESIHHD